MAVDPLVADYLGRLRAASWPLAARRRDELVAEVSEHIEAALEASGARDEASVRNVLDRLGEPEVIAAAEVGDARPTTGPERATTPAPKDREPIAGGVELVALLLLAFGGIVPVIGVLVGYCVTFLSVRWTGRARLYAGAFLLGSVVLGLAIVVRSSVDPDVPYIGGFSAMFLTLPIGGWLAGVFLILALRGDRRRRVP